MHVSYEYVGKEFIAYVKARRDELAYGSWGNGAGGHLSMESHPSGQMDSSVHAHHLAGHRGGAAKHQDAQLGDQSNRIAMYDVTASHPGVDWRVNAETIIHEAAHQALNRCRRSLHLPETP